MGENLRLGQRVSMLCSVTDGDLPLTLTWFRDEVILRSGLSGGISIQDMGNYESVLRIDNLRPEHNANFTCVAQNFAGKAAHSQTLRVKGTEAKNDTAFLRAPHQHLVLSEHLFVKAPIFKHIVSSF